MHSIDLSKADVHFIYDEANGKIDNHFLSQIDRDNVHIINCGSGAASYLAALDYALSKKFEDDTILYFVEDDYVHKPFWCHSLLDGFLLDADYVTLFDHADKYSSMYPNLKSEIKVGKYSHWRTTPSTTDTFAIRVKTLKQDLKIHRFYSTDTFISNDHQRFLELKAKGRTLISPIPAFSTHVDIPWISPIIDWEKYV